MLNAIRKHRAAKPLALFLALNLLLSTLAPTAALALTGGPSQPEFTAFTPLAASDMVNLFTGDFQYSIPLMDVGGYPLALNYTGGLKMNQQASWVGLGWDINSGAINREMRGIPDEFSGQDLVKQKYNMKPNITVGVSGGIGGELFGWDALSGSVGMGVTYNNYSGLSMSENVSIGFTASKSGQASNTASLGVGLSFDKQGVSVEPSLSFERRKAMASRYEHAMNASVGVTWNSRKGVSTIQVNGSYSAKIAQNKRNFGGGLSFDLLNNSYVPPVELPLDQGSYHANVKLGSDFFGADITGNVAGFFSIQKLRYNDESVPAFGYLYAQNAASFQTAMQDFNLEKDRAFTHGQTNLCLPNFTYDQYTVTGHGIGGSFRPMRSDAAFVNDRYVNSVSVGGAGGFELGAGNLVHGGGSITISPSISQSGNWSSDNDAQPLLGFKTEGPNDLVSPVFFKMAGEMGEDPDFKPGVSTSFFGKTGEFSPLQIELEKGKGFNSKAKGSWKPKYAGGANLQSPIHRTARPPRNQVIIYRKFGDLPAPPLNRYKHHIAEYTVTKTDGSRYVYGQPLYNEKQRDVTFNASGLSKDCDKGWVQYAQGTDNSVNNKNGIDHYFNAQELPPFAHSWLLTEVLSPDYVDADNRPGPSNGDLGTWVRLHYEKHLPDYKWRIPYELNRATFNEGLKTDKRDDKGTYSYGEKEVCFLDTIQTKTHIAIFYTSSRDDAYEVLDENGGKGARTLPQLDSIHLFARPDWERNPQQATPIKSVRFAYDYTLCTGIPSNTIGSQGKLTLKKVWFTYGRSHKGALSKYEFAYGDPDHNGTTNADYNPKYDPMSFNVWGDYKPNGTGSCAPQDPLAAFEFPFVGTNRADEDKYASAWMLSTIFLPEGGRIDVDFEADDYAYVQDKPAMQMLKVDKVGTSTSNFTNNELYAQQGNTPSLVLLVELPPGHNISGNDDFKNKYVKDIATSGAPLYFRFLTDLTASGEYEYVEGYATVADAGYIPPMHGYLKLNPALRGDKNNALKPLHPITKAAFGFGRAHAPRLMAGIVDPVGNLGGLPGDSQAEQILRDMLQPALINGLFELFLGPNGVLLTKNYGRTFIADKSWVRLYNPDGKRAGGGHRVKKITLQDNWDVMAGSGNKNYEYIQTYRYTLEDEKTSSGVAAYMPVGCKENPLVQPVFFTEQHLLAPDDLHYQERPFGESFFPSPGVGYRRVTVETRAPSSATPKRGTGKTVTEFYTAYDFPTRTDETSMQAVPQKTGVLGKLFKVRVIDRMTLSQGYSVEINNMHGQKKSERVYAEGQSDYISGADYLYETQTKTYNLPGQNNAAISVTNLKNEVPVILRDGSVALKSLGVDSDVVTWFSESETESATLGFQPNIATFLLSILPGAVPTIWPTINTNNNRFRATVTTKVIHRQGILKKVVAHDLGASVATENLAWDETGDVLLTRTDNEFGDSLYTFKFPAHWIYDGMGAANKNILLKKSVTTTSVGNLLGKLTTASAQYLVPGDELLTDDPTPQTYWVLRGSGSNLHLVDKFGAPVTVSGKNVTVMRSGRRNLQNTPVGSVTTTFNPIDRNNDGVFNYLSFASGIPSATGVLQAGATTFSELWQTKCLLPIEKCNNPELPNSKIVNPYRVGIRGNWRPKKAYTYLTPRQQTNYTAAANTDRHINIREDGQFAKYANFWQPSIFRGGGWGAPATIPAGWQWSTEVTKWLPTAQEVENVDVLGRYSAAQFGYNDAFAVAVAANSRYQQMGFDGFEDYPAQGFDQCRPPHFGFENHVANRTDQTSHSGRFSLGIPAGNTVTTTRALTTTACNTTFNEVPYYIKSCDCVGRFGPETYPGNPTRYVLSYWRKIDNPQNQPVFDYSDVKHAITPANLVETQFSKIIDGWQKVDVVFDLPGSSATTISVAFQNSGNTALAWIDDVRVHPFNATLKSFVYDPLTYRLWAELDERNFATFYQYDSEGTLIRVKKETERGVMTVEENFSSLKKQ